VRFHGLQVYTPAQRRKELTLAKFDVTPELGEIIRLTRLQNSIASKTLAAHLERSPAYISKLEKGEVKSIEESELTAIFLYIVKEGTSFSDKLEAVTETLVRHYSREICNRQFWLQTYDWVTRKITVPHDLILELNQTYCLSDEALLRLINRINANIELPDAFRNDKTFPYNQWRSGTGADELLYIKIKIEPSEIIQVLNGTLTETSYLLLYAVIHYLYRAKHYPDESSLTENEVMEISLHAREKLADYNIRTIVNQVWRRRDEVIQSDISSLLSSQDPEMGSFAQEIMSLINILAQFDLPIGTESLRLLNSNLDWDTAFTEKIMRLPFYDLEGVSHTNKKKLLLEIGELIQKYKNLPPTQKSLESYD
jgi:predicted transcriptional regulator